MRVQHNIAAINANRNLTGNNNAVSKSLEKLSSGYRVNRAGDDAAGLAISEKMRAQISCLGQAETNCNDGISLIQTAEGALTEVHSMLNRMVELAEQSANGTYDDKTDRKNLQSEVSQLQTEITRIANTTNFNGKKLLDGSLNNGSSADLQFGTTKMTASMGSDFLGSVQIASNDNAAEGITVTIANDGSTLKVELGSQAAASYSASQINDAVKSAVQTKLSDGSVTTDDAKKKISALNSFEVEFDGSVSLKAGDTSDSTAITVATNANAGLTLQIGEDSTTFNQLTVKISDMSAAGLGIDGVNIGSVKGAQDAVATIKSAKNTVSSQRGDLGAWQNRLEHTVNNLSVANENMTNAESRIRDTDMAKEMMTYTSKNILAQAAQSMLAQANQQPQQVLSLLQ